MKPQDSRTMSKFTTEIWTRPRQEGNHGQIVGQGPHYRYGVVRLERTAPADGRQGPGQSSRGLGTKGESAKMGGRGRRGPAEREASRCQSKAIHGRGGGRRTRTTGQAKCIHEEESHHLAFVNPVRSPPPSASHSLRLNLSLQLTRWPVCSTNYVGIRRERGKEAVQSGDAKGDWRGGNGMRMGSTGYLVSSPKGGRRLRERERGICENHQLAGQCVPSATLQSIL